MNHIIIRLSQVNHESIVAALQQMNLDWQTVNHVAATKSLHKAIESTKAYSIDIASLADLIVMPGMPGEYRQDLSEYPSRDVFNTSHKTYLRQSMSWHSKVSGRRMRIGIQFENLLRTYRRVFNANSPEAQAIFQGRRELYKTICTLVASGVRPQYIEAQHPISRQATHIWQWMENELPAIAKIRDDFWITNQDFDAQLSNESKDLRSRINHALNVCFGPTTNIRTIVHHGFFFYTSAQWALFQLLGSMPNIQQIFIVHDDGHNPVYESWRAYFSPQLLGETKNTHDFSSSFSVEKNILQDAFNGMYINSHNYKNRINLLNCHSPAEFVAYVNKHASIVNVSDDEKYEIPLLFAADNTTLNRYHDRLNISYVNQTKIDLSKLPVGVFLLRLHECIEVQENRTKYRLTIDRITDMISSGMLTIQGRIVRDLLPTWLKVQQFFDGCDYINEWQERTNHLLKVISEYKRHYPYDDTTDVKRMENYATNVLRLLPWGDIEESDAKEIYDLINGIDNLLTTVASGESVRFRDYMKNMRQHLRRGMAQLPQADRQQIETKLDATFLDMNQPLHVDGLYDAIQIILGRHVEFNAFGDDDDDSRRVKLLSALDVLGFQKAQHPIHIANLADGKFPRSGSEIGWPYHIDDLTAPGAVESTIVLRLLQMRSTYAEWGDIYLLCLAINGTNQHEITLSWISEIGSDTFNRSAFLELIADPHLPKHWTNVRNTIGGLPTEDAQQVDLMDSLFTVPPPRSILQSNDTMSVQQVLSLLPRPAVAANIVCARRFVLQWAMGLTASFAQEHQHRMLYGGMFGLKNRNEIKIREEHLDLMWSHLTVGERTSSKVRSVLYNNQFVHKSWIYTLSGNKTGTSSYDKAYQYARGTNSQIDNISYTDSSYIPLVPSDQVNFSICKMCPVKSQCSKAITHETR
jgi:hypothetical protein